MIGLLLLGVMAAQAQAPQANKSAEERAALKAQKMAERYTLTSDQKQKLEEELVISEKQITEKQALARKANEEAQLARLEQDKAIEAVLTPEQRKAYEADKAMIAEKRKERKQKRPGGRGRDEAIPAR
ncbi:MAG: hypothetical protein C0424_04830 [Sphingobacteriaceae bacterium]|nr:hypothetical protein [Sphingobacteriaceae bacterium]